MFIGINDPEKNIKKITKNPVIVADFIREFINVYIIELIEVIKNADNKTANISDPQSMFSNKFKFLNEFLSRETKNIIKKFQRKLNKVNKNNHIATITFE